MTTAAPDPILVYTPRGRDAELVTKVLAASGLCATTCTSEQAVLDGLERAACTILAQEVLTPQFETALGDILDHQPPWSDVPLILLTGLSSRPFGRDLGNVTMLERPITPTTLVAAIRAAIRGRGRQYQARAAIQQRDQFLAMLGHELRNPLGAIVMASDLLREDPGRDVPHRLAILSRQAHHLARLVDDLLDVARVTSGKVRLQKEPVAIDELVKATVEAHVAPARERGIELAIVAASGAIVDGDPIRLAQVLNNVLANAIKYSPRDSSVEIAATVRGSWCELRVRDRGIGIAPEMLKQVFELFAQAERGIERSDGGMGIGLTMVDRLVRLHRGTVEARSEGRDRGTELIVRLPLGGTIAPAVAHDTYVTTGTPVRAVVVEDSADLRALARSLLEALGCSVETATTGPEGLELVLAMKPELALIDIGLPGMDGFEVARALRSRARWPLLLAAVTGYGRAEDRAAALAAGFDMHYAKPVEIDGLRALVDHVRAQRAA
jgi:signal transduction histidine kinase/CheY-like chemotaxis protein